MSTNIFYIFKGDSNFCSELDWDFKTDNHSKQTPDGFYDIVALEDTVEGGIKVIRYSRYEQLQKQVEVLREACEFYKDNNKIRATKDKFLNHKALAALEKIKEIGG